MFLCNHDADTHLMFDFVFMRQSRIVLVYSYRKVYLILFEAEVKCIKVFFFSFHFLFFFWHTLCICTWAPSHNQTLSSIYQIVNGLTDSFFFCFF